MATPWALCSKDIVTMLLLYITSPVELHSQFPLIGIIRIMLYTFTVLVVVLLDLMFQVQAEIDWVLLAVAVVATHKF